MQQRNCIALWKKKNLFLSLHFNCFPVHFLRGIANHMLHSRNYIWVTRATRWIKHWLDDHAQKEMATGSILGPGLFYTLIGETGGDDVEQLQQICNDTELGESADTPPGWGCYPKGPGQAGEKGRQALSEIQQGLTQSPAPGHRTGWGRAGSEEKGASTCFPQIYVTKSRSETVFLQ